MIPLRKEIDLMKTSARTAHKLKATGKTNTSLPVSIKGSEKARGAQIGNGYTLGYK